MIKVMIGGSPCTFWSAAKTNGREILPEGVGWELFRNFVIAKEKFKPDLFLYENNKSISAAIKEQITSELGVTFQTINSALVSAQNRWRCYWHNFGDVPQPFDRQIFLKDVLESGVTWREKAYCLDAHYYKGGSLSRFDSQAGKRIMAAEPVYSVNLGGEPIPYCDKAYCLRASAGTKQGECNLIRHITSGGQYGYMGLPIRVGTAMNGGYVSDSRQYRVYSCEGKSVTLCGNGGGMGAKTGLYAVPFTKPIDDGELFSAYFTEANYDVIDGATVYVTDERIRQGDERGTKQGKYVYLPTAKKTNVITAGQAHNEKVLVPLDGGKPKTVYQVENGLIGIKGVQYPIKLPNGLYFIRKLTVTECCRLQTMPDDYCRAVSDARGYTGLGNGWTSEVVIHLLSHGLKNVPRNEPILVLSMYDGIGTGRYCLDKMGFTNVRYYAYEIDKYAIQVALSNYPDIIERGDAFRVRESDWGCMQ